LDRICYAGEGGFASAGESRFAPAMRLHGFFRSSASWRVRIVLAFKGVAYDQVSLKLLKGEQRAPGYLALNPQGLVPALELDGGEVLTQSLAICEYLDEVVPQPPLLPSDPVGRSQVRALALHIACEIQPLQNPRVLNRVRDNGVDKDGVKAWARGVIEDGLDSYEQRLARTAGRFSFGDQPTLADVCLVPQLGNARRFGAHMNWPRILAVEAACRELPAFVAAAPEAQPDAE
jgi:maleylpyruvate isomerase